MDWLTDSQVWIGLLTLTVLEIVLGIDNIIFISIMSSKLPQEQQAKARQMGLGLALITRILLLLSISWVMKLETELFGINMLGLDFHPTGRDLILIGGGLFLIWKSVKEIHGKLEGEEHDQKSLKSVTFGSVIGQILILDIIFSLDSVITAVGMVDQIGVMIAAVVIAVVVMLIFATPVSNFVEKHPSVKMLALAFLILIGVNLLAEGFHQHIPKGYTYFAMAFSVVVEMLNIRASKGKKPVALHEKPSVTED
ncbi:MAG: TerC family protein [Fimbriimonadaceae bacterium]